MASKMSTADLKGDTARGAAYNARRQADLMSKQHKQAQTKMAPADTLNIPAWSEYKELKQLHFDQLLNKRTDLKAEISFREGRLKELDVEIQSAMAVAGTEKVVWEDRPVQIVHSKGASKIVPEKLLERGVPADVIAESTVEGKGYSYLLVGKPKE
jgi:hypothetical protein